MRAAVLAFGVAGVIATAVACSGSASSGPPPTTGILIRAETLTSGKGCGTQPSQIYKYAVLVYGYGGAGDTAQPESYSAPVTSNVFDCYTDGAFISLPSTNGSSTFRLEVFAFNRGAYDAASAKISEVAKGDPGAFGPYQEALKGSAPTWTTQCSATQLENVQALASCKPLGAGTTGIGGTLGPTTITLDTASITLTDGRKAACAESTSDGGVADAAADADASDLADAAVADGGDAGDAGAPPAFHFEQVRVRTRVGAQILADTTVPCPAPYSVEVPAQPATYTLDLGLLDGAGNLAAPGALAECTAESRTGATSSASCR